ncbi:MAG: hypothetical protein JNN13_02695 [Planctomycetes bacterium]|nr:hypothetical protein [Planctomycetota bacterium]
MEFRLERLEGRTPAPADSPAATAVDAPIAAPSGGLATHSGALRRVATITFVLVIALVLRTLTDGGVIDTTFGVWLGVGYSLLLMAVGWQRFVHERSGRRVFTICGAVLLCSLVVETQRRFDLPMAAAHSLVAIALLASAGLGHRYRSPTTAEVGTLVAAASSIALGFPRPHFSITAIVLLFAMVAATPPTSRRAAWLPTIVFCQLLFFWLLWTFNLHAAIAHGKEVPAELMQWAFLPALAVTFLVLAAISMAMRPRSSAFAAVLPTATVVLSLAAVDGMMTSEGASRMVGAITLGTAIALACIARRDAARGPTAGGAPLRFAVAAFVAMVPGLWLTTSQIWVVLPAVAINAFVVALWSHSLGSGGLRLLATLTQHAVLLVAIAAGCFTTPPESELLAIVLGGLLATLTILHGRWARRVPPPAGSLYARLSPTDLVGGAMFWSASAAIFCTLRVAMFPVLASMTTPTDGPFQAAQSVLVNVMAMVLLVTAKVRRNQELLRRAVILAAVGGAKVFAADFLTLQGVPLVLAVFSFGVAAAIGSFVLGRWNKDAQPTPQ